MRLQIKRIDLKTVTIIMCTVKNITFYDFVKGIIFDHPRVGKYMIALPVVVAFGFYSSYHCSACIINLIDV